MLLFSHASNFRDIVYNRHHSLVRQLIGWPYLRFLSQDRSPQLAVKAFCESFVETSRVGSSSAVASRFAGQRHAAAHPAMGDGMLLGEGAPTLSVSTLRERLGEVMPAYRDFALTLEKRRTFGVDHPSENGLLSACGACYTAGDVLRDANGAPLRDEHGNERRQPLHAIQADGCMTGVRFSKAAPSRDALESAPPFVERVLPIEEVEGAAFRRDDRRIPGRGVRSLCDAIDRHKGTIRGDGGSAAGAAASAAGPPATPAVLASGCGNFLAADAPPTGGSSSRLFDTFGFFGVFCRHRVLLIGCHMFSGERHAYLTALLWVFLSIHSVMITNIEYDIASCIWLPGLVVLLALPPDEHLLETAKALLRHCLEKAQSPLMRFHFYCHRVRCQIIHDGWLMKGTAVQHGEGTEMKWSLFNRLAGRLKGMGRAARYAEVDYWWYKENGRQDVRFGFLCSLPNQSALRLPLAWPATAAPRTLCDHAALRFSGCAT